MSFMAPPFQAHGVVFVSAGYRLAPAHTFPTGFEDCADAVTWVYQHIGGFGGDSERIFVGGHSAGGHYASLLALKDDWQAPRGLPRTTISGALPISGTYYFTEGSGLSVRPRFLGPVESGHEVDASPMQHLRADAPRFLIAHGSADFPHLSRQAQEFEQALRKVGVPAERLELQGCDHGSASTAATESPWLPRAVAWMRER
jgi:acetyl esterase/lipase